MDILKGLFGLAVLIGISLDFRIINRGSIGNWSAPAFSFKLPLLHLFCLHRSEAGFSASWAKLSLPC